MPLAEAFARAGADVHVAVGAPFLGRLPVPTRSGLPEEFSSLAVLTREVMAAFPGIRDDRRRWPPALFGSVIPQLAIHELRRAWAHEPPDAVVHEALFPAAAIAAAELDAPSYALGIGQWWRFLGTLSGVARAALDGDPRPPWDVADALGDPQEVGAGYIDPLPQALQGEPPLPSPRLPIRTEAWSEPAPQVDASFMDRPPGKRPRVFVTLGTVAFGAVDALRTAVLGAARSGAEVIVACGPDGDPAALGYVPGSVSLHRYVPQAQLLPTVDVVVHHGGTGTMLAAVQHAVPQLVLPQGADQFVNAEALSAAGIGLRADPAEAGIDGIAEAVGRLLEDERIRGAVSLMSAEIAARPSPDDVAHRILAAL
jgi:hypothetical protein